MKDPDGNETLCIRLLDADTGRELAVMLSAGVHSLTHRYMDVSAFSGRNLRLELVDRNTRTSYAWIGPAEGLYDAVATVGRKRG